MGHKLICAWLKIPTASWPPDPYTLLGLEPGDTDLERIERHVQERMEWVRCYQLAHPELATEAMNRLAQAFDCLRNQKPRTASDAPVRPSAAATAPPQRPTAPVPAKSPPLQGQATERRAEPAATLAQSGIQLLPAEVASPSADAASSTVLAPPEAQPDKDTVLGPPVPGQARQDADERPVAPPPPVQEPLDPALEAARSAPARRGLGTKRALYYRISRTRRLIRAWVQAGKYLGDADYRLTGRQDAIDLVRQLTIIRFQLHDYPLLLGQAGQPGYLVIALARQPEIVKTFQGLSPGQRTGYVRDWQAGLALLAAYRLFLREELRQLRRQTRLGRLLRAVRAFILDYPGVWLFLLALLTVNLTWPSVRGFWPLETVAVLAGLLLFCHWQNLVHRQSLHRIRRRPGK